MRWYDKELLMDDAKCWSRIVTRHIGEKSESSSDRIGETWSRTGYSQGGQDVNKKRGLPTGMDVSGRWHVTWSSQDAGRGRFEAVQRLQHVFGRRLANSAMGTI